jgi:hypothetical protein
MTIHTHTHMTTHTHTHTHTHTESFKTWHLRKLNYSWACCHLWRFDKCWIMTWLCGRKCYTQPTWEYHPVRWTDSRSCYKSLAKKQLVFAAHKKLQPSCVADYQSWYEPLVSRTWPFHTIITTRWQDWFQQLVEATGSRRWSVYAVI